MPDQALEDIQTDQDLPLFGDNEEEGPGYQEVEREPSMHEVVAKRLSEKRRAEEQLPEDTPVTQRSDAVAAAEDNVPHAAEPVVDEVEPEPDQVTVKVYGKNYQVSREDVDAAGGLEAYQKRAAATELLRRTNEGRKQLREEQRRWAEEQAKRMQGTQKPESESDDDHLESLTERFSEAQLEDDRKGMAKAMRDIMSSVAPGQTSPNVIETVQQIIADNERKADQQAGIRWLQDNHPEIVDNRRLLLNVDEHVRYLEQQYPDAPPSALIKFAAEEALQWVQSLTKTQRTDHSTDQRVATKRAMNTPGPASQRKAPAPARRPATTQDYVARRQHEYDPTRS